MLFSKYLLFPLSLNVLSTDNLEILSIHDTCHTQYFLCLVVNGRSFPINMNIYSNFLQSSYITKLINLMSLYMAGN